MRFLDSVGTTQACRYTCISKIQFSERLFLFCLSFCCNVYKSCFQNGEVPSTQCHALLVAVYLSYAQMKKRLSHGTGLARKDPSCATEDHCTAK